MTRSNLQTVACQHCQKPLDYRVYREIDLQQDPQLTIDILNQKLFSITCPHCLETHTYHYDLVVSHPGQAYVLITCYDKQHAPTVLEQVDHNLALLQNHNLNTAPKFRLITHPTELREKITIFAHQLLDTYVELEKLSVIKTYFETIEQSVDFDYFTGYLLENGSDQLCFYFYHDDQLHFESPFNASHYRALIQHFPKAAISPTARVDNNFGLEILQDDAR